MKATEVRQNLKLQAYSILKEKIVSCEYSPGSMLNEARLATELGFSRTPIREAISILEMEGFLHIVPKKGILVTDILLSDIVQIFQARMEIEPVALKLAGPNIPREKLLTWKEMFLTDAPSIEHGYKTDTAMHLGIIGYCNNAYIIDMMKKVFDKNTRIIICSKPAKNILRSWTGFCAKISIWPLQKCAPMWPCAAMRQWTSSILHNFLSVYRETLNAI